MGSLGIAIRLGSTQQLQPLGDSRIMELEYLKDLEDLDVPIGPSGGGGRTALGRPSSG